MTAGPGPLCWSSGESSGEIRPPSVAAIDTLGAGDLFHGAFCHAYAVNRDFSASLAVAAETASRSTAHWGPRLWIDHRPGKV
jgi:sugar/nucleoside kinase (ribokinase family)